MAITQCPDCGKDVSTMATTCPHCGYPLNPAPASVKASSNLGDIVHRVEIVERKKGPGCLAIIVASVLMLWAIGAISQCQREQSRSSSIPEPPVAHDEKPYSPSADMDVVAERGVFRFVETVSRDPDAFRVTAASLCATEAVCNVGFWRPGAAPRTLPMSDAQVASKLAMYGRNLNTGYNDWAWSCEVNQAECAR